MSKKIIHLFIFFLIVAISLSPRLSLGYISGNRSIDIRVEDIILSLGLLVWFLYMLVRGQYNFKLPPLFWQMFAFLSFGFFSVLANILLGNIFLDKAFF
jgi:nitrate reductase NapE component